MAVEMGWSKDPNAGAGWKGGEVSGMIAPDRNSRIRLVSATGLGGLEPSAEPSPATIPNNHLSYAMQWFLFAGIAALDLCPGAAEAPGGGPAMTAMRLTTLPSGLRVATRAMPGLQTAAVGLFAGAGSRDEPAALNGIAHLFEHMVFKGAGGRSARELSEAIEEVGGDLNAATERDATSFTATVMAEHVPLAIELIADMILKPHFADERPRARKGRRPAGTGRGARHAERHGVRPSVGGRVRRPGARPLDPRRRSDHRQRHAWPTSTNGATRNTAPGT